MDQRTDPRHPEHTAFVASMAPEVKLLHDIFCACMDAENTHDDLRAPHGPASLRHPYTRDEIAAMGY